VGAESRVFTAPVGGVAADDTGAGAVSHTHTHTHTHTYTHTHTHTHTQVVHGDPDPPRRARWFLLRWSMYSSLVIRDLTLRSAPSFGSFHLMRLLYDEYLLYLVEQIDTQVRRSHHSTLTSYGTAS
jgi:hypothetical protein